jgi:Ion channel.
MMVLAFVFLGIILAPEVVPQIDSGTRHALMVAGWTIWVVFVVEYCARLALALDRREFVKRNVLDLLVVAVPMLRPLRALRSARLLRVAALGGLFVKLSSRSLAARTTAWVVTTTVFMGLVSAFAVLDLERNAAGSNIKTPMDALWWALTTITTVGYGDRYPTTPAGRGIAALLMLCGVALLSVITASIASWFVGHFQRVEAETTRAEPDDVSDRLAALDARLGRLESKLTAVLAERNGSPGNPTQDVERTGERQGGQ